MEVAPEVTAMRQMLSIEYSALAHSISRRSHLSEPLREWDLRLLVDTLVRMKVGEAVGIKLEGVGYSAVIKILQEEIEQRPRQRKEDSR